MFSLFKKIADTFIALLIALFLTGAGGAGTYLLGGFLSDVIEVKSWEEVPCRVDDLWLEDEPYDYPHVAGAFSYRWKGKAFTSNHLSLTKIYYSKRPLINPMFTTSTRAASGFVW